MRIVALDTAGRACSVALMTGDAVLERIEHRPRRHAATVLPMLESLLHEAGLAMDDLDGIVFGRGPGSFTGLRIAASVTQGLAFGADLPVAPVSSLAAAATAAHRRHGWQRVLVANDARMGEIYGGCYVLDEAGLAREMGADALLTPEALALPPDGPWHGAGTAFAAWPDLADRLGVAGADPDLEPVARDLLPLGAAILGAGKGVPAEDALPVYLREKVAWTAGG
ncbi:MAG: tRNA (adenosine(37)-N6)-threonylcarbamoyltransferase complex dimerization subunit type 1 TsaB [Gammaproteobacteria bacterium]